MVASISVQRTEFRIAEPKLFDPKWYSFKDGGPGLRYEIDISISRGSLIWTYGSFECDLYNHQGMFNLLIQKTGSEGVYCCQ